MPSCEPLSVHPIGVFHADARYTYDVPRQGVLADDSVGKIVLEPNCGYEQALEDLDGFSYIWLLFWFDRNSTWRPKIQPPRHLDRKVGVFASRSPYRPNPIGLSAVKLLEVKGREIIVAAHDLLDQTPILDIKPYLPYADAFPNATPGWTAQGDNRLFNVRFSPLAERQLQWLEEHGVTRLRAFALDHLTLEPDNPHRHRLVTVDGQTALAYRTWRMLFAIAETMVLVSDVRSGYSDADLAADEDRYEDKPLHRAFKGKNF